MNRIVTFLLLLIITASVSSCSFYRLVTGKGKGQKIVLAGTDTGVVSTTVPPIVTKADTAIKVVDTSAAVKALIEEVTPMWARRLDYTTFSGKAKMHLDGPGMNHDFTAHIRIRKDSVIWINITAVLGGFQVARLLVNRDSIFMLSYLENEVTLLPLSRAAKILPAKVDFASMQNLIIGEPLRDGIITDAKSYPDSFSLRVEDTSYMQRITYARGDSMIKYGVMTTHSPSGPVAITQYNNYEVANGRKISTLRVLTLRNGNDTYTLDMNFTKTSFDEPLEFPFSIPKNYKVKQVGR